MRDWSHLDQVLTRMPAATWLVFAAKHPDSDPDRRLMIYRSPFNFGQFVPINRMFNRRC
jgi:hypothetical protein